MEYINLHRSVLASSEFVGAEPVDRATWIMLLDFCCGQENGGVIKGCGLWSEKLWIQAIKIDSASVKKNCPLWRWDGDDLVVAFYAQVFADSMVGEPTDRN